MELLLEPPHPKPALKNVRSIRQANVADRRRGAVPIRRTPPKSAAPLAAIQLNPRLRGTAAEAEVGAVVLTVRVVCPLVVPLLSATEEGLSEQAISAVNELGAHVKFTVPVKPTLLAVTVSVEVPEAPGLRLRVGGAGAENP